MDTTQDNRLLTIETPLGKDYFLIEKLAAREAISELFSFEVELLHAEDYAGYSATVADIQSLLGKNVSIEIMLPDELTTRSFCGIVSEFTQGGRDERFSYYTAKIVPQVWILTQISQSRIFQHLSVPDILKKVLTGFEVSYELEGTYKPRNYCVQYGETNFDFISRLMEEEGIFYYFEHKDRKHKLIVADSPKTHRDCPSKSEIPFLLKVEDEHFVSSIRVFNTHYRLQTGKVAFRDYNFQQTNNKFEGQQPSRFSIGGNKDLESYGFPGGYAENHDDIDSGGGERSDTTNISPQKDKTAEVAMQALDATHKTAVGRGNCASMTAGYRFKLKNNPNTELNKNYIVTAIKHQIDQSPSYVSGLESADSYHNEFNCLLHGDKDAPPFRPNRKTRKPLVRGSQTAKVVGPAGEEIFTDKFGRVKVQFHWDREGKNDSESSCWMRVGTLWAGKQWGAIHIPRIGQEVIVDFIEGDPDQPIIVGSVYNPDTMPPYDLPANKTQSGVKSRSSKGGSPANFNEFRFEDKIGKEEVYLHAEKDWTIMVEHDKNQIVGHDETALVKHDRTKTVNNDETTTVHHDRTETVDNNETITIGVNRTESVGVNEAITIGANRTETVGGNEALTLGGNQTDDIGGNRNSSIGGDEKNSIGASKSVNVATKYSLSSAVSINESSSEITISASKTLTLSGPGGSIKIDAGGVTIFGVLVKIN